MDALWSAVWGRLGALLIWGMPLAVHSLSAGAGIWPPAFPPRSPRGKCIPLQLPGLCSPWQAVHSLPARRGGPLQHKTGCWRTLFLYPPPPLCKQSLQRSLGDTKKPDDLHHPVFCCGEGGIRTPGTSQFNGFQDRRNRPLCHLSFRFGIANVGIIFFYAKINCFKCEKSFSARDSSICVQGPKSTVSLSLSSCQGRFLSFW